MQVVGQNLYIKFVQFEVVGMDMGPYSRVTLFGKFHYTYLRLSTGVYSGKTLIDVVNFKHTLAGLKRVKIV